MRWFKHETDSLDSPFIQSLLDKFEAQGYLAFFGLREIIAKEVGHDPLKKVTFSPSFLRRKFRISSSKLEQIFRFCAANGELLGNFSEEKWEFQDCKLLELKDNYSKDLQGSCKKLAHHKEVEVEVDKKKKIKKEPKEPKEIIRPENISSQTWNDYIILRKKKTAPITQTVINSLKEETTKAGITLEAAIKECCSRGWQGFKAEWYLKDKGQPSTQSKSGDEIRIINGVKYKGPYKVIE